MNGRHFALAWLVAGSVLGGAAHAQQPEQGCISLKTEAQVVEHYVDAQGNAATRLVAAAKVVPGDEVVWTIVANNICSAPAADIAITNAVPAHMHYVADTAFGPGSAIQFSLDGQAFADAAALVVEEADGSTRAARADEYSHIRWTLDHAMGPSESLMVRYRATVL
jgi:uncharacterized repeat protein (TIGR01451 family)